MCNAFSSLKRFLVSGDECHSHVIATGITAVHVSAKVAAGQNSHIGLLE
jgi:hypothetical protein